MGGSADDARMSAGMMRARGWRPARCAETPTPGGDALIRRRTTRRRHPHGEHERHWR